MKRLLGTIQNAGQKNSRFLYYARNAGRLLVPPAVCRRRLAARLRNPQGCDEERIADRVNYYCKLAAPFRLDATAAPFRFSLCRGQRNYYLDLREYLRFFDPRLELRHRFGDETAVPAQPTLVKARPIAGANAASVLFNFNKIRHFVFIRDPLRYEDKLDRLVWRGNTRQELRRRFLAQYHDHPLCDVGHAHGKNADEPWSKGYLPIAEQLKYKFILSLEGNDVASNLKWILSSNSLCFMPPPRNESWFMEGRLIPGRHYVALAEDFSDLEDQIAYYASHAAEARNIVAAAQRFAAWFRNPREEDLVALRVLRKYFELSGQAPAAEN